LGLESVELFLALEAEFGIGMPNQIAHGFRTVGDLADFVALAAGQRAAELGQPHPDEAALRSRVADVIAEELGVRRELVTPDAELVRDLALDS